MKRGSVRTLLLLIELLVAVAAYQFLAWAPPAKAGVMWLNGDPNEPVDPNLLGDLNGPENPQPEAALFLLGSDSPG